MKPDPLGDWRRTHFSTEIVPELSGEEAVLMGWVTDIRDLGGIKFFILQDIRGSIQVTAPKSKVDSEILDKIDSISKESAVGVKGKARAEEQAPRGVEIIPSEIRVLNPAKIPLPLDPTGHQKADLDTRLNSRLLDLRRPKSQAIFKIKHAACQAIREYLISNGFIEIHTPKIVRSATETGATLFPISYFEREAFLSQSPQLYKEVLTGCLDKVFEFGPIFRAEEHDTRYHLNEVLSTDIEVAFVTKEDVMGVLEDVLVEVFKKVKQKCSEELKVLEKEIEVPEKPIPRITYDEALDKLEEAGKRVRWGEDFSIPEQRELGNIIDGAYFVSDWPADLKPFYIMAHKENPKLSHAFDLLYDEIELASGGTRVHQKEVLIKQLKNKGLSPKQFKYHLKNFEWGLPPHSGWGLGIERLTMALTGARNIRECVLFPRDQKRLTP
ncbi:aspartate--tRNA ligase [candidate division MSBL1 archaeon SCGC-AAA385D11]|uniref:Aspartate--tRNA(Asp/Asn) ligase n=1 Tax=candidate division MSBL1 archaeon SCGC-AAA385D11 TaxID=1698286 RepID=A0A133VPF8_9EURY|nr:aspartate--tRNA ligase [candidate division MSBL1 archaeon SCGC-AAA385D11]